MYATILACVASYVILLNFPSTYLKTYDWTLNFVKIIYHLRYETAYVLLFMYDVEHEINMNEWI